MCELHCISGFQHEVKSGLAFYGSNTLFYLAGQTGVFHNLKDNSQKFFPIDEQQEVTAMTLVGKEFLILTTKGSEPKVSIYNLKTGDKLILKNPEIIRSDKYIHLSISCDNEFLGGQCGFPDWKFVLWNWNEKQVEKCFRPLRTEIGAKVYKFSFSPEDSTYVAVVGHAFLRLYHYEDRHRFLEHPFHDQERTQQCFHSVAWKGESCTFAVGSSKGTILVFRKHEFLQLIVLDDLLTDVSRYANKKSVADKNVSCLLTTKYGLLCSYDGDSIYCLHNTVDGKNFKVTASVHISRSHERHKFRIVQLIQSQNEDLVAASTDVGQILTHSFVMSDLLGDLGYEAYFLDILGRQHKSVVKCTDSAICRPIQATCSSEVVILRDFLKQSVLFWEKMENKIYSVAIHPLGLNLLIGYDKGVKFYNILLNKLVEVKHFDDYSYPQVSLSKAGHMMVFTSDSEIHVYNLNFERYAELKGHKSVVNQVIWRDDNHLISSDQEGTIHEWDIIKKKEIWVFNIPEQTCTALAVSTDNTYVASSDGKVRRFSNAVLNGELDAHVQMTALVIADTMLLGGTMKGSITAFPLTLEGGAIFEIPCHQSNVINLRLKDGGCTLLATGEDGMISTWRVQNVNNTETDLFAEELLIERKVLEEEDDLILEMETKLNNQMAKYENDRRLQNEQHEKEMTSAIQSYKAIQKRHISKIMELTEKNYTILSASEKELLKRIEELREKKDKNLQKIEVKILNETEHCEKLIAEREKTRKHYESEISKIKEENESNISTMWASNEKDEIRIKELEIRLQKELDARDKIAAQNKDFYRKFEELTAKEAEEFNSRFRSDLEKHLYENSLITSEIEILRGELKYEKECCHALDAEFGAKKKMHENLESTIKYIKDKITQLHDDICRKESVLDDKGSMTAVLEEEAKEMVHLNSEADWKHEDYRKVLEIKIKELNDIDKELKKLKATHRDLVSQLKMLAREKLLLSGRLKSTEKSIEENTQKLMKTQLVMERYKAEFVSCTENIQDSKALRWAMLRLLQMRILKGPIKEEEVFVGDTDPYSKFCRLRDHYESLISTILNRTKEVQTTFRKNYVKLAKENSDWTAFGEALRTDLQQKEERISCLEEALQMPWNQFATDPSETQRRLQNAYENLECLEKAENEEIQKRLSLIEVQDKELQRLHGLLVVDERGIVARKMAL